MHLQHLGTVRERAGDALVGRCLVASDRDKGEQRQPKSLGIDLRAVATDDAAGFELPDALEDRGGRQADRAGDVRLGFTRIRLELIEDLEVDGIECSLGSHNRIISAG